MSPSSQASSPHSWRAEEPPSCPSSLSPNSMEPAGVQLLLLRGRTCLWWGWGRLWGRSWDGRAVLPPGKGLGCLEGGPRCCRCCPGSAGVGLLHAVELFLKKAVLHSVLTSNLESLSSSFQEKLANPPHVVSLCQATSCLLSPHTLPPGFWFFFRKERNTAPFLPSLYNSEDLTRKGRTAKSHLMSPRRISDLWQAHCGVLNTQRAPISYCPAPSQVHKTLGEAADSCPTPHLKCSVLT